MKWNDECKTLVAGDVLLRANKGVQTPFTAADALILPVQHVYEQIPE